MLNQRLSLARRIASDINESERAADLMVCKIATLISGLSEARMATNVPASMGQDAFDNAGEAMALAMKLRSRLVAAHENLVTVRAQAGLGPYAIGDGSDCPPLPSEPTGEDKPLKLVSAA
ncbi:hypothetical protein [Sphingomonas sp. LaA6.9]|uniref:hypothetical protein n=1 Tax=Sphingomonas sp. LaA6.9 TaxID=2919914 RepID=UPI001F4F7B9B|nr:hypothetical protein [Sphingomonas sp. LaA6.9]MCJ8157039.1 hypothetical protein [Sphingomonas sp. LaA6.9]